jgi:hypothetical protein
MIRRLSHSADVVMFLWPQCERDHTRAIEGHTIVPLINRHKPFTDYMANALDGDGISIDVEYILFAATGTW